MFSKFIPILIILSALSCEPEFQPETTRDRILDLSGNWEIETKPEEFSPPSPKKKEPIQTVPIPSNLIEWKKTPNESILLRKRIFKTEEQVFQSLCLGKISDQTRVFFNGTELQEELFSFYQSSVPQGYDRTRIYTIPQSVIREENEIEINIKPYFEYEFGILSGPIGIGPSFEIWKEFCFSEIGGLFLFSSFLLIGGFFIFLSAREKRKNENFYFGFFLVFFSFYQISLSEFKYLTGWQILYLKKLEYSFLVFLFPLFCRFLGSLLKKPERRFQKILEIGSVLLSGLFWFSPNVLELDRYNRYLHQTLWVGYVILSLQLILPNLGRKKESGKILFGILFLVLCVGIDALSERGKFSMIRLSGFGVSGFLFFLTLILSDKFVGMKEKLRTWNQVLEMGIRKRTKELTQSLQEVRALKEQQDGDYFLITLLFQPFLSKDKRNDFAKIEVYRRQYKRFQFKNRNYEIGGDVVLNESVFISGIEYQVLINADAMGKSLQGASGALIFCSIVKSFLQTPDYEFRSPENWLFHLYKNLQAVFESFDGSMLVSSILSLYRIETGDLFFLNCEHPPIVLLRNREATYLLEEVTLRKIGFPSSELPIRIESFQVLPEDTILFGSDGREDLFLSLDEDPTQKQKTSSPEIFFQTVQDSIPNLEHLEGRIRTYGELSDDLSFLKIQRAKVEKKNLSSNEWGFLLKKGKEAIQKEEWQKATAYFAKASILKPSDFHLAKICLLLAKKTQNFKLIRLFSEKVALRSKGLALTGSEQTELSSIIEISGGKTPSLQGKVIKKAS
ncbi:SpoIIE family protein phosphatase [Leptospira sp. 201903070]|uniref:SpoIIE family protein phosphatase n=1 Tax=Leptospira ainlahdjerensis TaxID=2810033 RepID=A0ABS2UAK1_9LEPT|nr:SpoIIE family protein phosphatase [Leptospira ainlahdjerensis]MBM9577194.1 SpoIIE family protein phosphatase [Leptospira ainlahdjerensis]